MRAKHWTPAETMASSEVALGSICQSPRGSPGSSSVVSRLIRSGEPFVHGAPPHGDGDIIYCPSHCVSRAGGEGRVGGVISSRQLLPSPKYFRKIKSNPCPLCGAWKLTLCVHMTLTKEMKTGLPPTEGRTQEAEALPAPSAAQCACACPLGLSSPALGHSTRGKSAQDVPSTLGHACCQALR